jgi:hypothetical protein
LRFQIRECQQIFRRQRPTVMMVAAVTMPVVAHGRLELPAQAEVGDELAVAVEIFVLKIAQKAPALTDLHQQAAAAVVILLVDLQVLGQLVDRRGEDCDLHVG